jgi:hypothetical protein
MKNETETETETEINVKIDRCYLKNIINTIKKSTSEICISFGNDVEFLFYSDDTQNIPHKIILNYESYNHNLKEDIQKIIIDPHVLYTKIYRSDKYKYVTLSIKYKKSTPVNTKLSINIQKHKT